MTRFDAFARMDSQAALKTGARRQDGGRGVESIHRQCITFMMEDPRTIRRALEIMWIVRALERIGDHAKNICEYVIYMVHGKDIRHTSLEDVAKQIDAAHAILRTLMTSRQGNLLGFAAALSLLPMPITPVRPALEPCPLCIFQRVGVFAIGLVFLNRWRCTTRWAGPGACMPRCSPYPACHSQARAVRRPVTFRAAGGQRPVMRGIARLASPPGRAPPRSGIRGLWQRRRRAENTQRTGLQVQDELGVIGIGQQA